MKELDDIVQFENENTNLDFKAIQYKKNKYENFLKDVISMANAKSNDDKYIIIGVNHKPNGERDIIGINEEFVDEAIYQQIINENVEPELDFKYFPYELNNIKLGVFLIQNCLNPPYMLKKDFGKLNKGDCFIRKGSHQTRVTRNDIDYFISQKVAKGNFKGSISLEFNDSKNKILILKPVDNLELPSDNAANEIKEILKEKKEKLKNSDGFGIMMLNQDMPMIGGTPYKNRSISTLEKNLESVKETYQDDDLYYLFEKKANRINITITNNGDEYIEDSSIEIQLEKNEKFIIADSVYREPNNRSWIDMINYTPVGPSWDEMHYPKVTESESHYTIFENVGDLKHKIPVDVFKVPIRFVAGNNCLNQEIVVKVKVFGKNLSKPLEDELKIIIKE
jgi:hypothetical protein